MSDALSMADAQLCVDRLVAHQREHRLSDASLVRLCPPLGSARSWRRMAAKDWVNLPLETWLPRLQEAVTLIAGSEASASIDRTLPPTVLVSRHLAESDRCRLEGNLTLARSHCRVARKAIEDYQRSFTQTGGQQ